MTHNCVATDQLRTTGLILKGFGKLFSETEYSKKMPFANFGYYLLPM